MAEGPELREQERLRPERQLIVLVHYLHCSLRLPPPPSMVPSSTLLPRTDFT